MGDRPVKSSGTTPNGSSAHLNHYDELVELAREVASAPMPYPAHARETQERAKALLARLPNQGKAALAGHDAVTCGEETRENLNLLCRKCDAARGVIYGSQLWAARQAKTLRCHECGGKLSVVPSSKPEGGAPP